jgi:hypothetical protein
MGIPDRTRRTTIASGVNADIREKSRNVTPTIGQNAQLRPLVRKNFPACERITHEPTVSIHRASWPKDGLRKSEAHQLSARSHLLDVMQSPDSAVRTRRFTCMTVWAG